MRTLILFIMLCVCSVLAHAQSHSLHLNTNCLITQKPVFGFGYAFSPDSSRTAVGCSFEFGRFVYNETGIVSTAVDKYEESGIGFRPEVRRYFGYNCTEQRGLFVSSWVNCRLFYANHSTARANDTSGTLEYQAVESNAGRLLRTGVQIGYRKGCGPSDILVEVAAGGGYVPYATLGAPAPFFQLDVSLVGFFKTAKSSEEEDYVSLGR